MDFGVSRDEHKPASAFATWRTKAVRGLAGQKGKFRKTSESAAAQVSAGVTGEKKEGQDEWSSLGFGNLIERTLGRGVTEERNTGDEGESFLKRGEGLKGREYVWKRTRCPL